MKKILATCLLAVLTLVASTSEARRPIDYSGLVGVWNNTNAGTRNIVRVVIRRVPAGITVQTFGACTPTPCNHGIAHATSFTPNVGSPYATGFSAFKNFGFKQMASNAIRIGDALHLLTQNKFAGGDSRFDYTVVESFVRLPVEAPDATSNETESTSDDATSAADRN